jgi:ABC-type multidrug transport system ATPase subunit/uncharacterized tellurite resistance protein B-like protein
MSEPVLKSIIQLMAISSTIDGAISDSEKGVIFEFIQDSMNEDYAKIYRSLFNEYAEIALAGNVEATNICNRINHELNQKQKIIVLIHLLELASVDGKIDDEEVRFVDSVAEAFNLDIHEYNILKAFVTDEDALTLGLNNILVISKEKYDNKIKHIYKPQLTAIVGILRIPSVEMYMLKYFSGDSNTFLNGLLLKDRHTYNFPPGSVIRNDVIGPVYYSDVVSNFFQENHTTKITFEAKHVYYTFTGGKIGLRDINLGEESGRLIGIMGSSGSGKSTLLNVLNGNEVPVGGKVTLNGIDIHDEEERVKIKGVFGYVPQDDLLIEELTVYQNLYYAAKLCFGNYAEQAIKSLVEKTLQSLGLAEIAHLKVGNTLQKTISGGQRKRVNIGLELLREPAVLFCDEPTSGLSSNDSENIMDLLKELSLKGKLIFTVIHQPSSDIYKMFDKLIILDVGGYQIYYGNPIEAVTYFRGLSNQVNSEEGVCGTCGNVNAEQIFSIIENKVVDEYGRYTNHRKVSPVQWRKHFEEVAATPKVETNEDTPDVTFKIPSKILQWIIFTKRDVLAKLSNTQYMVISLLEAPLLALLLSYIVRYYHIDNSAAEASRYLFSENMNLPAYIFMSIIVALFIGLTVSAEEIIKDARIRKRERLLHLSRGSYLMSKITILFTFSAIQTLSFVVIGNWMLDIHGLHLTYWLVLFTTTCFANMLGLNISSAFNSVITIYILIPILLIPQLILGGIVVKFSDINPHLASSNKVPIVSELMTSRWALEALIVSQFKNNDFEKHFYEYDQQMAMADYKKIYYIPKLESTVAYILASFNSTETRVREKIDRNIRLLHNEISLELRETPRITFKKINAITSENFDAKLAADIKEYLQKLNKYYTQRFNQASDIKDKIITTHTKTPAQRDAFVRQAEQYHNKTIADLVKNTNELNRIVEIDGKLIQRVYPIYITPKPDPNAWIQQLDFRTHFYAPTKHFFGYQVDTLVFNVIFIWAMTLLLYVLLYFDILRETFNLFIIVFNWRKKKGR